MLKLGVTMKKLLEKIQLVHIVIILFLAILIIFWFYQNNSTKLKQINIDDIDAQVKELPEVDYNVQNINNKIKKITCAIDVTNLSSQEYFNYVSGKGVGIKVNCSIILKLENKFYKLKTLLQESATTIVGGKINLVACVKNKYLKENYEILLYDNDGKQAYKYVGGTSEETNK